MSNEAQTIANRRTKFVPSHIEGIYEIINYYMQNKPNFRKSQMNVSIFSQKAYENKYNWTFGENKPNQTQFQPKNAPNKPKSNPISIPNMRKQTQSNPFSCENGEIRKFDKVLQHFASFFHHFATEFDATNGLNGLLLETKITFEMCSYRV